MKITGQLQAIWIKRMKRGLMDTAPAATLVAGRGLVGNANQGGKRQVTLIEQEVWEGLIHQTGGKFDPTARRANLMVSGIRLANTRGQVLRIGAARIRIYGETKPCERMDEAHAGLRAALYPDWGGGVFGEILDGGLIRVGDTVEWEERQEANNP